MGLQHMGPIGEIGTENLKVGLGQMGQPGCRINRRDRGATGTGTDWTGTDGTGE